VTVLHLDFETRSAADLKAVGLAKYAEDPSTDVMCIAFAFDDEPVQLLETPSVLPQRVTDHVVGGGLVYAHNAAFERAIWEHVGGGYGWVDIKPEQMRCTMAMAYAMGLPGSLDGAAAALGIEQRKDAKGARVMLQLAKPRKVVEHTPEHDGATGWIEHVWWDDPAKLQILYDYCKQDVEVERALHKRMMELSPDEQSLWLLDQHINARGIQVDREAIDAAIELVTAEKARLDQAMREITGNVVAGCTDVAQLTNWLRYRGVSLPGVAKADVVALLDGDLPDDCRTALKLRQEAAKSSTAKLTAMRDRAGSDGRMRGLFQYHGAATGRWAGRGPQPHNFPRPAILHDQADIEDVIAHFGEPEYLRVFYGDPVPLVADCMRGMIVAAPGHTLICCDYSNIEGRVLAWLAGEEWKLDAFRAFDAGTGPDLYRLAYARAFGIRVEDVDAHMRQMGKIMELALGYGGGVGAFQAMARAYGVRIHDDHADELKHAWRGAHAQVVKFWADLERAAIRAVTDGGVHRAGPIAFKVKGSFLWCQLPSKRVLCYPYPQLQDKETPWGKTVQQLTYMSVNGVTQKWERCATYGGSLAENVTQAVARDILVAGMRACEAAGYPVVMHVHDEIVAEVPLSADLGVDKMSTLMCNAPQWAAGLPIAAAGWTGRRYRKD
jgi:DNA polymerase